MPRKKRSESVVLGVASAVCGVASIVAFFSILPSILLGVTGIVCGVLQVKANRTTAATVGLVTSVVGILFAILTLLAVVVLLGRTTLFA